MRASRGVWQQAGDLVCWETATIPAGGETAFVGATVGVIGIAVITGFDTLPNDTVTAFRQGTVVVTTISLVAVGIITLFGVVAVDFSESIPTDGIVA